MDILVIVVEHVVVVVVLAVVAISLAILPQFDNQRHTKTDLDFMLFDLAFGFEHTNNSESLDAVSLLNEGLDVGRGEIS